MRTKERARIEQAWYCEVCGAEGHLEHWPDEDALTVKKQALAQHATTSPQCASRWLRYRGHSEKD